VYLHTREDALDAVAAILDLDDRREQILQSSVRILACLDPEPRSILADCQALLLEGGLEALRARRRDALASLDRAPLLLADPEGDRLFQAAAGALDALSLAGVVRQIFPDLRAERWQIARALLRGESALRDVLSAAIRARGRADELARRRREAESLIASRRPSWGDRAGTLRAACLDVLKGAGLAAAETLHPEAERLFEVLAASDERAGDLLLSLDADPADAVRSIVRLHEAVEAVRSLPFPAGPPDAAEAA
jgi:hypothetical protein